MITQIGHQGLKVKNMEESIRFYSDILGFKEVFRIVNENGKLSLVYLYIGHGQFLELFPDGQEEYKYNPTAVGHTHLCYEVADIQAAMQEVVSKGITLDSEIRKGKSGCLQFWIHDPDGNRIELMQITPDSMQGKAIAKIKESGI